jgi:hypothetical protein
MFAIIYLLGTFIADLLKSRRRLEVENLFLRHQLNIILRRPPQRLRLRRSDRALMVWMTREHGARTGVADGLDVTPDGRAAPVSVGWSPGLGSLP